MKESGVSLLLFKSCFGKGDIGCDVMWLVG